MFSMFWNLERKNKCNFPPPSLGGNDTGPLGERENKAKSTELSYASASRNRRKPKKGLVGRVRSRSSRSHFSQLTNLLIKSSFIDYRKLNF